MNQRFLRNAIPFKHQTAIWFQVKSYIIMVSVPPVIPVLPGVGAKPSVADEFAEYVYNFGFLHGAWPDVLLQVGDLPIMRVHALFVSQSPVLYQLLSSAGTQMPFHITLASHDAYLTSTALSTALGTLYGHPIVLDSLDPDVTVARGLLASGTLLGLDKVIQAGKDLLVRCISAANLPTLFEIASESRYAPHMEDMKPKLTDYLLKNLKTSKPDPIMMDCLARLPFKNVKDILEHPKLQVADPMQRQAFAKLLIKKRAPEAHAHGLEERVVLSFGQEYTGIEVIQRPVHS